MARKRTYAMTAGDKKLKADIIELMRDKGIYENTDANLINELIYNLYISREAKAAIAAHGIMVNVRADPDAPPLYQVNQAVGIYNQAIKAVLTIFTKLSINPQEREKLGLASKEVDDPTAFLDEE